MRSREAFSFLAELEKKGTIFGLERTKRFLRLLGNPEKQFKFIHIAGSKGKGSTAAMIARILQSAGYKTALYTSPHLVRFNERIQINGKQISGKQLVRMIAELKKLKEKNKIMLTHFEFTTALAFKHFADSKVDFAVLETGMGGRLDATNVVKPRVCAITNIEKEHTQFLGNTITKIAREKAGIIKKGIPLVTTEKKSAALRVFRKVCGKKGSPLTIVKKQFNGKLGLLGSFQRTNAALALATIKELQKQGFSISKKEILNGLAKAKWRGRFEIMRRNPTVILDCCHTPKSARALAAAFKELFSKRKAILVIGASNDKDIAGIAANLAPITKQVFATEARYRAMPATRIQKEFAKLGKNATIVSGVKNAVRKALAAAKKKDIVLVAGSCFVVREGMLS